MAMITNPFLLATFITFVIVKVGSWLWNRYCLLQQYEKIGLKGPLPNLLFGNFFQIRRLLKTLTISRDVRHFCDDLIKKYGTTLRILLGADLSIVTVDPKVISEVYISKFSKFTNRPAEFFNTYPLKESVFSVTKAGCSNREYGWKEIRTVVQQALRPSRIKMMFPLMVKKTRSMIQLWSNKKCKDNVLEIDIYEEFQALTVDVICECSFGLELNSVQNRQQPVYVACGKLFNEFSVEKSWGMKMSLVFPKLSACIFRFTELGRQAYIICDYLRSLIENRIKFRNLDSIDLIETFFKENEKLVSEKRQQFHINTIISNCLALLLAGYDTTSNSMTFAINLLGKHPEVMKELVSEIDELFTNTEPTYDAVMKAPYLDAFFKETLRYYTPVMFFASRVASEDVKLESIGITVPKGTTVIAPTHLVCGQESVWENADEFIPERFLYRSHPVSTSEWMPFGAGPRNCVGSLLAEVEFKINMVEILKTFRVVKASAMNLQVVSVLLRPAEPVIIGLEKRFS